MGNSALGENLTDLEIEGLNWSGAGAGILASDSSLTLYDCEISSNVVTADYAVGEGAGGGIYGMANTTISINNEAAKIISNESDYGGGIYTEELGILTVSNGEISENGAANGAGIYSKNALTVLGGTISGNIGYNGGGIYSTNTLTISGGTISENSGYNGGGIYSINTVTLSGGTIDGNSATMNGGGIYGKYVVLEAGGTGVISNNDAIGKSASKGGGMYIKNGSVQMYSGEICYNAARSDGGGIKLDTSTITYHSPASINDIHDNTPNNVA